MNTRRTFLTGGAALTGAALFTMPSFAAQEPQTDKARRSSLALEAATQASLADTHRRKHINQTAYLASATASIRLMAAMFENQNEVGDTARDEAALLSNPDALTRFQPTAEYIAGFKTRLQGMGVQPSAQQLAMLYWATPTDLENAFQKIKSNGLVQFYRDVTMAVELKTTGSMLPTSYHPTHAARLQRVAQLDQTSCDIIKIGGFVAAATGQVYAAVFLAIWYWDSGC